MYCWCALLCKVRNDNPKQKIIVGNPAQIKGDVSDEMIKWKTKGTKLYQTLPQECRKLMRVCEPLIEIDKKQKRKSKKITFDTWKNTKS